MSNTLRILTRDVVNPRKRDKRLVNDWDHRESYKKGMMLVHEVEDGPYPYVKLRPRGSYPHQGVSPAGRSGRNPGSSALYDLLMESSEQVDPGTLGALIVEHDASAQLDRVLVALLQLDVPRETIAQAFKVATHPDTYTEDRSSSFEQTLRNEHLR